MRTIREIIKKHGGNEALKGQYIRLKNDPYMPLSIKWIGTAPNHSDLIAVSHTYIQNGDLMRDPEIVFLVSQEEWLPVSYRNDSIGAYTEAIIIEDGKISSIRPQAMRDLKSFARIWDRNIKSQGFMEVIRGQ